MTDAREAKRKAVIGFKAGCGCPTFALVLGYQTKRQDEKDVEKLVKQGYSIKVMHPDEARKLPNFLNCPHKAQTDPPKAVTRAIAAAHR